MVSFVSLEHKITLPPFDSMPKRSPGFKDFTPFFKVGDTTIKFLVLPGSFINKEGERLGIEKRLNSDSLPVK
jgi:hypothetical protein